jgi:hypothetical protein
MRSDSLDQGLLRANSNSHQVITRLSEHDMQLQNIGNTLSDIRNGSAQTAMTLQKILGGANSGQLDPRHIYVAVPIVALNPYPYLSNVSHLTSVRSPAKFHDS